MKLYAFCMLLLFSHICNAQYYSISGHVADQQTDSPIVANVSILVNNERKFSAKSSQQGFFLIKNVQRGNYTLVVVSDGFARYQREIFVSDSDFVAGNIRMQPILHTLGEVKIVAQVLAATQNNDTTEYNSEAYKVNAHADAADLVRKMPGIEVNGKELKAQGETVLKVLVDGKPFFGDDPWATLKNLPADVIQKVQVYNEKSDQERFTGFREGPQNKTINIVTKADKRRGVFGNVYAGGGVDNSKKEIYGTGCTLNRFNGNERITLTTQLNNINVQNFTESGGTTASSGSGITTTRATGVNYTGKWGKTDVSSSYQYTNTANDVYRRIHRTYMLPAAAGQVYDETSPATTGNNSHRVNMRISYAPDTMNTLLITPSFTVNGGAGNTTKDGTTTADSLLNTTRSTNANNRDALAASANALYTHRFGRRGRTFSAGANVGYNGSNSTALQYARNIYYTNTAQNTILNQQVVQKQQTNNASGNATWTEPAGKGGMVKAQYDVLYSPSQSDRITYNDTGAGYIQADSLLSGSFVSANTQHKTGLSYQFRAKTYDFSIGVNYQATTLHNEQSLPATIAVNRSFSNLLPVATLQYRMSRTRNLQCNYTARTNTPSVAQLQDVVNNTDPMHLATGNPQLRLPYSHNAVVRYNASGSKAQRNFSASLSATYTQYYIAQTTFIATTDTLIGKVRLPVGAQLSMPVNVNGNTMIVSNMGYSLPLSFIKCRLNVNLNIGISRSPAIVNGVVNYQQNATAGGNVVINSNVSEKVDFSLSSNTAMAATNNPANQQANTSYISQSCRATVDLVLWKGIIVSTLASYQANLGLSSGFNRNYLLWNMAVGKKLFKKQRGDIRFTTHDLLNQNNNIQRTTTETYIQDIQTNILQRYFMLVFTYKISSFGK